MNFPGTDPDAPGRRAVGLLRPLEPLCASALSGLRKLIVGELIVDSLGKRQRTELPKSESRISRLVYLWWFGFRFSDFIRISSFGFRHFCDLGSFLQGEGARLAMLVTTKCDRLGHARAAHLPLRQGRGRGHGKPNDECRNPTRCDGPTARREEARVPNDEKLDRSPSDLGFRHSFVIRPSDFVISPSCFEN